MLPHQYHTPGYYLIFEIPKNKISVHHLSN